MWKSNIDRFKFLITILLFLFAVGFMKQSNLILLSIFLLIICFDNWKLFLNKNIENSFWLLVMFSVLYFIFTLLNNDFGIIAIGCPIAFYIGTRVKSDDLNNVKKIIMILAIGMSFHIILNFFYEYKLLGAAVFTNAKHYDVWSRSFSTATGIMTNGTLLAGMTGYFIFSENRKIIKFFTLICVALLAFYNLSLGGRTFLYMIVISVIASAFFSLFYTKINKSSFKFKLSDLLFILLIVIMIFVFITRYYSEISKFFENSYFYHRFFAQNSTQELFKTPRSQIVSIYLSSLLKYPWGGNNLLELTGFYAHNLWLDTFDQAGIIVMILLMIYSIISFCRIVKILLFKNIDKSFRIMIGVLYICIFLQFFLEPVLNGSPILFFSFFIIDGMLASIPRSKKGE